VTATAADFGWRHPVDRRPTPGSFAAGSSCRFVAADLLLTLGDVARSRFHVPSAMLIRILELADPVATCADDRIRFEAFSACCSVYGRVDLLLRLFNELAAATSTPAAADARPALEHLGAAGGQAGRLARSLLARG
jgi:hypothetical protein